MSKKIKTSHGKYYKEEIETRSEGRSRNKNATPPPLSRATIEDLIKKRELLKKELRKMEHNKDEKLKTNNNYDKKSYSNNDKFNKRDGNKRTKEKHEDLDTKRRKSYKDAPEPSADVTLVDSEDEETLIEKSRQRRKQLLEKLNVKQTDKQTKENKLSNERENPTTDVNAIPDDTKNVDSKTTDMFSEHDEFLLKKTPEKITQDNKDESNLQLADNWNDPEGYYIVKVGDEIDKNRYTIKSILGQGVFSNVVRAQDKNENTEVAIKIIRDNNVTYKTGLSEIAILEQIKEADPDSKQHCIKIIRHFMHKNHLCIVLESLFMDLRQVIKKYGRHHGLNIKAIVSYSAQLFLAMRLLKKIGVVHADIKPDNILVNENKNILKLCDFGSASKDDQTATPYLVSRFYRAPEIILGIPFKHSIDIWSAACTIYEMTTGKIMFPGNSNNKMLKHFMDLKGKFSAKMIRKGKFKDQHFNYNNNFLLHNKDGNTGREKLVEMPHIGVTRDLMKDFKKCFKNSTEIEDVKLNQLKDLLDKMLTLDPNYRYTVSNCLKHSFVTEKFE